MDLTIRWDIRAASAVLALSGTLVIVLTWSLVNAFADIVGFSDLNRRILSGFRSCAPARIAWGNWRVDDALQSKNRI